MKLRAFFPLEMGFCILTSLGPIPIISFPFHRPNPIPITPFRLLFALHSKLYGAVKLKVGL